jgi:small conductance mechanosensitive channel
VSGVGQILLSGDGDLMGHMVNAAGGLAVNLTLAGAILFATLWASRSLSQLTGRAIAKAHRHRPADTTLQTFAASMVRYFVVVVGLIAVLQQLGVKATSVIAVLGAASLAIGLALQGALGNVAAGVMLLILRPYRVGDRVEINGKSGVVKGLDLFSTRLADLDNLNVFVPNGKAFGEIIVNYTSTASRRVVLDFTIDYQDDVDLALTLLLAAAAAEARVHPNPPPWAKLTAMGDSGVTVTLRVWSTPEDNGDVRSDLMKAIKETFEANGLSFPYPHQVAVESRPFDPPRSKDLRPTAPRRRTPKGQVRGEASGSPAK